MKAIFKNISLSMVAFLFVMLNCTNNKNATLLGFFSNNTNSTQEAAGITITESGSSTDVTEGSAVSDSYTIVLTSQPSSDVTISLTNDSQITLDITSLTFTSSNWDTAQTINVTSVDNSDTDGNRTSTISHAATSSDGNYNGITISDVSVNITDDDIPNVSIMETSSSTSVSEASGNDTYDIQLTIAPTNTVTVSLTFDDSQIQVNGSNSPVDLTFSDTTAQTLTITAVNDSIAEGSHSATITHSATSSDSNYNGISISSLTVSIADDDTAGITLTESGGSTDVEEGYNSDSYTIVLTSEPTSDVAIDIAFDTSQLKVKNSTTSPVQITFTSANWSSAQTISVKALYDSVTEGSHTSTISHTVSSSDSNYNSFSLSSVTANITDNEGTLLSGSIQSGTASSTGSISITSVDTSKSFVHCGFRISGSAANNFSTCQLNSTGDTVLFQSGGGSSVSVNWYVAEFSKGVSVQRGSETMDSSTSSLDVTLSSSVDLSRTFVIVSSRMSTSDTDKDERRTVMAQLTTSTNLQISRNETGIAIDVEWQVVQMDGAKVQSGTTTLSGTSATASLTSVDESTTFLIFNSKASSDVDGVENRFYTRGTITDSTTITFNRETSSTGSVDISWYAIEMIEGTVVQKGSGSVSDGSTTIDAAIPSSVADTTKTMVAYSNTVLQTDNLTSTSDQDSGNYSYQFIDSSNIQFTRGSSETRSATLDWFTVEFQ